MSRFAWIRGLAILMLAMNGGLSFADESGDEPATSSSDASVAAGSEREGDAAEKPAEKASESAASEPNPDIDDDFLADPFTYLELDMHSAASDLGEGKTKPPADVTQPRIISRLDYMIAELEKTTKGGGAAGRNPVRPANASTLARGPGGQGELRAPRQDGRQWADLTEKEREKILQSKTDGFPAGYDDILADYFRRVARGRADTTVGPDAGATDADGVESAQP